MQQRLKSSGERSGGKRVLVLASDAHGGFGGISQYNRDVIEAMATFPGIAEIRVLPRIIHDPGFEVPLRVTYSHDSAKGPVSFISASLQTATSRAPVDLIYCGHINLMPAAAAVARLKRCPIVLNIHGIEAWKAPSRALTRYALQSASMIFSVSQLTLDRFNRWSGMQSLPARILHNSIKPELYGVGPRDAVLSSQLGIAGKKVIMTLGRMAAQERYKGFDEVLEEMPSLLAEHPDLVYLAAGDGPDRARLEAKAVALDIADKVIFTGRVPEERKADYYRLADAYVMPSSGEGFGFVVIEALACGIPVVASLSDGTREALRNGELGILIDPTDRIGLRQAIGKALDMPKHVPKRLSYFYYDSFVARLRAALHPVVDVDARAAA